MNETSGTPERVADWLRRTRLDGLAVVLLEAFNPWTALGAQAAYLIEPLVGFSDGRLREVARLLEDPDQVADLLANLHEVHEEDEE